MIFLISKNFEEKKSKSYEYIILIWKIIDISNE